MNLQRTPEEAVAQVFSPNSQQRSRYRCTSSKRPQISI